MSDASIEKNSPAVQKTFEEIPVKHGRPVDEKCFECAKTPAAEAKQRPCYMGRSEGDSCRRKRWYYKNLSKNRKRQRSYHRSIKYREDQCFGCKSEELLEVHHIIPKMFGGKDAKENAVTLCQRCHWIITRIYGACFTRPKDEAAKYPRGMQERRLET